MAPATSEAGGATAERPLWDRWGLLWQGFFAVTLAAPTALALVAAPTALHGATTLGTAAAFGAWHWWTAIRRLRWEGRLPMLLWFAGALAFTWVLLGRDERFVFLVYGLYPQVFWLLGRRLAVPGAVALTLLVFWRTGVFADGDLSTWIVSVGGSVLLAVLVGLFVTALARQSAARKEALEELEATRAELAATARRAGILEERQRLAREVHDTVAQGFTGIVMQLEASEQALDADPARAREHLVRARRSARASLGELRRSVQAMRPGALEGATLAEAVARTVRRWSEETGVVATAGTAGAPVALPPDSEIALLRAVQEALANVAKHAGATRVAVRLDYTLGGVELAVEDDGAGFDPSEGAAGDGLGLRGMAERMAALGGRLTIDSAPGGGTRIAARVSRQ